MTTHEIPILISPHLSKPHMAQFRIPEQSWIERFQEICEDRGYDVRLEPGDVEGIVFARAGDVFCDDVDVILLSLFWRAGTELSNAGRVGV
jgi:hypothetical protein